MQSHELSAKVQLWREKIRNGTLTVEEQREAISILREGRIAASKASSAAGEGKAKRAAKAAVNSDSLLDELEGL